MSHPDNVPEKNEETIVLDTSEILISKLQNMRGHIVIPRSVVSEIRRGRLRENIGAIEENLDIRDPSHASLSKARDAAGATGDLEKLSGTDIDVIAVALDTNGTVYSDDYSVQNVCRYLDIPIVSHGVQGIRSLVTWEWQCSGCRKIYKHYRASCEICGHPLKRKRRSEKVLRHP